MSEFNANDYLSGMDNAESLKNSSFEDNSSAAGDSADSASTDSAAEPANATHEVKSAEAHDAAASADAESEKSSASNGESSSLKSQEKNDSSDAHNAEEDSLTPLGKAKKEAAEYLEALQRERAEFINFRKRSVKEQTRFREQGVIDVLDALLPALDDIDRIREHSEMDDSFKAVATKIDKAFARFGVEKFGVKGEDFDPTKHDAILHRPDPDATKETVDAVVEAGYRIGERVIRAARVVVASPDNA